MKAYNYTAPNY